MHAELVFGGIIISMAYVITRFTIKNNQRVVAEGFHTWAIVREYKNEYVRVAGSWTWMMYPQVDYITADGEIFRRKLKYASSEGPLLPIEEEIEVILFDGILYYKPALVQDYQSFFRQFL